MNEKETKVVIDNKIFIIVLLVLLLLIVSVVAIGIGPNKLFGEKPSTSSSQVGSLDIDEGAGDWDGQNLPDKTENPAEVGIKIPGYPSITLPANQKTVNVALLNPEDNPCYFTFELVLNDSGESLYKSKLVPPGKAITEMTMSRSLKAGEYDATIKITTTSVADGSAMNGANVETVLIVK